MRHRPRIWNGHVVRAGVVLVGRLAVRHLRGCCTWTARTLCLQVARSSSLVAVCSGWRSARGSGLVRVGSAVLLCALASGRRLRHLELLGVGVGCRACLLVAQRSPTAKCGLTPRSSRPASAGNVSLVRGTWCIIAYQAYAACLRGRLTSNVRQRSPMSKFRHHSAFQKAKQVQAFRFPHVCFNCRKSFKFPVQVAARLCPQCRQPMVRLSRKFSAPKASDLHQWEKVRYLVERGFLFYPVQEMIAPNASRRVSYPQTLAEAKVFVEKFRSQAHQRGNSPTTRRLPPPSPISIATKPKTAAPGWTLITTPMHRT